MVVFSSQLNLFDLNECDRSGIHAKFGESLLLWQQIWFRWGRWNQSKIGETFSFEFYQLKFCRNFLWSFKKCWKTKGMRHSSNLQRVSSAPLWIQITLLMMMKNSLSPDFIGKVVVDVKIILCVPSYPIHDTTVESIIRKHKIRFNG